MLIEPYNRVTPHQESWRTNTGSSNPFSRNTDLISNKANERPKLPDTSLLGFCGEGFRRMTDTEAQSRRERGLCFRCDEKYSPTHRCKARSLQVLLVTDEDSQEEEKPSSENDDDINLVGNPLALSMNSIMGMTMDKTLKIRGMIGDEAVIVLVDSGASHNFISKELVQKLGLNIDKGKQFGVMVGNGFTVKGEGICRNLSMRIQEVELTQDFFPFDLGGADVVLGISWLSTLGDVCSNWKKLTMAFDNNGKRIVLQCPSH